MRSSLALAILLSTLPISSSAGILTYGDANCLGLGCYNASDPTAGATLQGLTPGNVSVASTAFSHLYPFAPSVGDFPGTDQIFVGSVQTGSHDGYSAAAEKVNGPAVFTLDYSSLLGPGQSPATLTLGIAADDFQFPGLGQPFLATVNGTPNAALTTQLNALNQAGPLVQFFTLGLDPSIDTASHVLTVSIDDGGDGGDGFAVDFLTVGVTTAVASTVAEPTNLTLLGIGLVLLLILHYRRHA